MSFIVENKIEDGFYKIVLKEVATNTAVEIIPSCGGILHSFTTVHNGKAINVIDHYDNYADYVENLSSKGFKSCKLSPFACRINNATYQFENKEYNIQKFLLGKNALHGLLYDANYTVTGTLANNDLATVTLFYNYTGSDAGYPFTFSCSIQYLLQKNNSLSIITTIKNTHNTPIPMQDGWHPYFTLGNKIDTLKLSFQSAEQFILDANMIPTTEKIKYQQFNIPQQIGTIHFDDCFSLQPNTSQPACVLSSEEQGINIEIYADKNYPYLQIYTPNHRNSIAIENLSAIPDCFNNGIGLLILQPNQQAEFITRYQVQKVN